MNPKEERITVEIDPEGNPTVTARGVKGEGCKALTAPLEAALGGDVITDVATADMYERPTVTGPVHRLRV